MNMDCKMNGQNGKYLSFSFKDDSLLKNVYKNILLKNKKEHKCNQVEYKNCGQQKVNSPMWPLTYKYKQWTPYLRAANL